MKEKEVKKKVVELWLLWFKGKENKKKRCEMKTANSLKAKKSSLVYKREEI